MGHPVFMIRVKFNGSHTARNKDASLYYGYLWMPPLGHLLTNLAFAYRKTPLSELVSIARTTCTARAYLELLIETYLYSIPALRQKESLWIRPCLCSVEKDPVLVFRG